MKSAPAGPGREEVKKYGVSKLPHRSSQYSQLLPRMRGKAERCLQLLGKKRAI